MLPATFDLTLYQGDDYSLGAVIYSRNTDGSVGAAVNLTSYTPSSQIRATPTSNSIIATFTCTVDPDQTTNTGLVTLTLAHGITKDLPIPGSTPFAWDLQFVTPAGLYQTFVKGAVSVLPEVTR